MELLWKYIPGGLHSHVVTNTRELYRRSLCGVAPLVHLTSFDTWQEEPEEHTPRRCALCAMRLAEHEQELADVHARTGLAQEGRSI